jgi:hypothetical protein
LPAERARRLLNGRGATVPSTREGSRAPVSGKGLSRRRRQEKLARRSATSGKRRESGRVRRRLGAMSLERERPRPNGGRTRVAPGGSRLQGREFGFSRRSRETTVSKGTVLPKVAGVNFTGESLTAIIAHSRAVELARRPAPSIYVG